MELFISRQEAAMDAACLSTCIIYNLYVLSTNCQRDIVGALALPKQKKSFTFIISKSVLHNYYLPLDSL